jgi:hypothetical protein
MMEALTEDHPVSSPHLNPTANLWATMKRHATLRECGEILAMDGVHALVDSMASRMNRFINGFALKPDTIKPSKS